MTHYLVFNICFFLSFPFLVEIWIMPFGRVSLKWLSNTHRNNLLEKVGCLGWLSNHSRREETERTDFRRSCIWLITVASGWRRNFDTQICLQQPENLNLRGQFHKVRSLWNEYGVRPARQATATDWKKNKISPFSTRIFLSFYLNLLGPR